MPRVRSELPIRPERPIRPEQPIRLEQPIRPEQPIRSEPARGPRTGSRWAQAMNSRSGRPTGK
jgi:hypothetical protein